MKTLLLKVNAIKILKENHFYIINGYLSRETQKLKLKKDV